MGGGGEGPLPSPPPRPARTPLAPTRAAGTRRNRSRRGAFWLARQPVRSRSRRPGSRVICTTALPTSAPPPPRRSGGGRRLPPTPRTPPRPLAPSPYQLGGEPGRPSGIEKRADTGKFWGREGRALKGPRPLFSLEKKEIGGGVGGEIESCSAVEWRKQCQKGRERLLHRCVRAPRPFPPNTPIPHSTHHPPSISESHAVVWQSRLIPPGQPSVVLVEVNVGAHTVRKRKWAQGTQAANAGSPSL